MKRNRFSFFLGFILPILFATNLLAADLKEADELFDKGTFQAALEKYDEITAQSPDSPETG